MYTRESRHTLDIPKPIFRRTVGVQAYLPRDLHVGVHGAWGEKEERRGETRRNAEKRGEKRRVAEKRVKKIREV